VNVWVPPGGAEVMHHRFRGFHWNLVGGDHPGTWLVHEIAADTICTFRFEAREAFRTAHPHGERARAAMIVEGEGYSVEAHQLDHGTPSMGYVVREASRVNIDTAKLSAKGFSPGPWLKRLRGPAAAPGEMVNVNGKEYALAALQEELLVTTRGESVAYLTDFRLNAATADYLAERLRGVTTLVCESQYAGVDRELAEAAYHSCADEVASVALRAGVGKLILFHVSSRYVPNGVGALLAEARSIFPNAAFPEGWKVSQP
jgi:ribonuclease Z